MSKLHIVPLAAALVLAPNLAHAFTYTFCFKHSVHVVDSNFGEDFEASPTGLSDWISRGTKDDAPHDFETVELDVPGAFAFNWEGTMCFPKLLGESVEGDWLRHFWNFLNDPTGTDFQPQVVEIAALVEQMYVSGGLSPANAFSRLTTALNTAGFAFWNDHWSSRATTHGVIDP